jgi:cation diffusion facilitator CzcD-associated flavoprotein CzcO
MPIKSVAVIGAGPAGAIAVDALAQENTFDVIRVYERQEKAGGCWYVHGNFPYVSFAQPQSSLSDKLKSGYQETTRRHNCPISTA